MGECMFQFRKIDLVFAATFSMAIRMTAVRPKEEEMMSEKEKSTRSG